MSETKLTEDEVTLEEFLAQSKEKAVADRISGKVALPSDYTVGYLQEWQAGFDAAIALVLEWQKTKPRVEVNK